MFSQEIQVPLSKWWQVKSDKPCYECSTKCPCLEELDVECMINRYWYATMKIILFHLSVLSEIQDMRRILSRHFPNLEWKDMSIFIFFFCIIILRSWIRVFCKIAQAYMWEIDLPYHLRQSSHFHTMSVILTNMSIHCQSIDSKIVYTPLTQKVSNIVYKV